MASEIKVNNIKDTCGTAVITKCGATHTVTAEVYKANTIQDTSGNAYIAKCGSTVTLGGCGQTISLAAGASQSGFGRSGSVNWDTTAKTASFTAVSGNGYFVNTTSGAITMTLPATPSAGDIVAVKDYAGTFATNNLTIARNGSNLDGAAADATINTNNTSLTVVYVDATKGWVPVEEGTGFIGETYMVATGGTITCCGDYKIHTFTGPGTFTVSSLGSTPSLNKVSYAVVAGGAGGGFDGGGGGGAGGYREGKNSPIDSYTASPLAAADSGLAVTAQSYPITVGGGSSGTTSATCTSNGSNSVFSTITSAGGGGSGTGGGVGGYNTGKNGGSGGGGAGSYPCVAQPGGTGNQPPTSPPQGNNGGLGGTFAFNPGEVGGGGGGATQTGFAGSGPTSGPTDRGDGGDGATTSISGSSTSYAGGGGGGSYSPQSPNGARQTIGGVGGGGNGGYCAPATPGANGTTNTGGGAGGGSGGGGPLARGGNGGSGIVIIRYKFQ